MKLEAYRNLWGVSGPRDAAVAAFLEAGYVGIEAILFSSREHAEMSRIVKRRALRFKGTIWTKDAGRQVSDHLTLFKKQLWDLLRVGAQSINVIGGHDCWTTDEADRYFEGALEVGGASGVPISHELHRNSALFHPTVTRRALARFPELRLTCDFSHWVVGCERLIDDQLDLIRLCAGRADHLHTRIGTVEAPQTADPRAPEARPYVRAFERWWTIVWEAQFARGVAISTHCPEFGPPPYLPTLPYSRKPVADLADICDWQMRRQATRFRTWVSRRRKT
ncbi:MAG TPA: hypothetical protein VGF85_12010 [Opitutaceae bacterium]|jgi:hypothetical protein